MDNETKNQNLTEKSEDLSKPTEKEQDVVFFNVMPKVESNGEIIEPKINSIAAPSTANKNKFWQFVLSHKLYFIIGAILVFGGPIIYFVIITTTGNKYKSEDLLVLQPVKKNPPIQKETFTTPRTGEINFFLSVLKTAYVATVATQTEMD